MNHKAFPVYTMSKFSDDAGDNTSVAYDQISGPEKMEELHGHDFFMMVLIEKGGGKHIIDSKTYELKENQIHLVFPEHIHALSLDKGSVIRRLMINHKVYKSFSGHFRIALDLCRKHPVVELTDTSKEKLQREFYGISLELSQSPPLLNILKAHLSIIAEVVGMEFLNDLKQDMESHKRPLLLKYLKLTDLYYKEHKSVRFYANELNISANYLNILCMKHLKITAKAVIQNRIILEAQKRLFLKDTSIKEIGIDLGFESASNFTRFYKTVTGMFPKEFRDSI